MEQFKFKKISATNYCESIFDGSHDSHKYYSYGHPLVTVKHLNGRKINISNAFLISAEDFEKLNKRCLVKKNDVLISMIGTVGKISIVLNKPNFAIKNIGVLRAKNELDAKYLYYYLTSTLGQLFIQKRITGSTQPTLNLDNLLKLTIFSFFKEILKQHIVNTILFNLFF